MRNYVFKHICRAIDSLSKSSYLALYTKEIGIVQNGKEIEFFLAPDKLEFENLLLQNKRFSLAIEHVPQDDKLIKLLQTAYEEEFFEVWIPSAPLIDLLGRFSPVFSFPISSPIERVAGCVPRIMLDDQGRIRWIPKGESLSLLPIPLQEWCIEEIKNVWAITRTHRGKTYLFIYCPLDDGDPIEELYAEFLGEEDSPSMGIAGWWYFAPENPRRVGCIAGYGWVLPNPTEEHLRQVRRLLENKVPKNHLGQEFHQLKGW